jgi:hypothetical protein
MKYQDALKKIEKWLEEKGIREHCRTVCKGNCCFHVCGDKRCSRPPLPCAIYLCKEMKEKLFGFHNGEKYHAKYLIVTSIVFGSDAWDLCDMGKIAEDIDVDIPNRLIESLVTMKYAPDIHGWPENVANG